jgi:hypothetical protein
VKFLADRALGNVRGPYRASDLEQTPVNGFVVYDVPDYLAGFTTGASSSALVSDKYAAIMAANPSLPNLLYQEFETLVRAGLPLSPASSQYLVGVNKRTALLPGGVLYFGPYGVIADPTTVYAGYSAYELTLSGREVVFSNPLPGELRMELTDSAGGMPKLGPVVPNKAVPAGSFTPSTFSPANVFYVRLSNVSSRTFTLSDFCLLWD